MSLLLEVVIIFIIASLLTTFATNYYVRNALAGIRCAVVVLVFYALIGLAKKSVTDIYTVLLVIAIAILAILVPVIPLYAYIIFAGFYGFFIKFIKEKKENKKYKQIEEENKENQDETLNDVVIEDNKDVKIKKERRINYYSF